MYEGLSCSYYSHSHSYCHEGEGQSIVLEENQQIDGIDFLLERGGQILGRITDATTGLPIQRVSIGIYDDQGEDVGFYGQGSMPPTGKWGTSMALRPGTYFVKAWARFGYNNQVYAGIDCVGGNDCSPLDGLEIEVEIGKAVTGVDFALQPASGISGRVTDEDTGLPISYCAVSFYDETTRHAAGHATADIDGVYHSGPLSVGPYYVKASALAYFSEIYDNVGCPGSCDMDPGTTVAVTASETTVGIDFALRKGATIRGTVVDDESLSPMNGFMIYYYNENGEVIETLNSGAEGHFQNWGPLTTGRYYAKTWNEKGYFDEVYQDISCPDPCDPTSGTPIVLDHNQAEIEIQITLRRGSRVMANVLDVSSGKPIESVTLHVYDDSGQLIETGALRTTGWVATQAMEAGTYFVKIETPASYPSYVHGLGECWDCEALDGTPLTVLAGQDNVMGDLHLRAHGVRRRGRRVQP